MTAPHPMRPRPRRHLHAVPDPEPQWLTFLDGAGAVLASLGSCAVVMIAAHDHGWRMTGPLGTVTLAAMVAVGGTYIYLRMSRREQAGR